MDAKFETAFAKFLEVATALRAKGGVNTPQLTFEKGRKNIRVISESYGQRSVYCFVDIASGDILKSASWKAPAKGARGSIYSSDNGLSGITVYGANYNYR